MKISLTKSLENFKIRQETLKNLLLIVDHRNCATPLLKKNQSYFLKKRAQNEEKDADLFCKQ
jgi:hypothetical protein